MVVVRSYRSQLVQPVFNHYQSCLVNHTKLKTIFHLTKCQENLLKNYFFFGRNLYLWMFIHTAGNTILFNGLSKNAEKKRYAIYVCAFTRLDNEW